MLLYFLLKLKQTVCLIELFRYVRVGMVIVEKLDGMKTTAIDIEMDVAKVEVRCACLPDFSLRVQCFDGFPDGLTNTFALYAHLHIEKCQLASMLFLVNGNDGTTHALAVSIDCLIGFCAVSLQRAIEVLVGQHLPLVGIIFVIRQKATFEGLLHFLLHGDGLLLPKL